MIISIEKKIVNFLNGLGNEVGNRGFLSELPSLNSKILTHDEVREVPGVVVEDGLPVKHDQTLLKFHIFVLKKGCLCSGGGGDYKTMWEALQDKR